MYLLDNRPHPAFALAGRPLRFIGPGFPGGVVSSGYSGDPEWELGCIPCLQEDDDKSAYVVQETDKLLKDERMYFDLHLHYKSVVWAIGDAQKTGVVEMVLDNTNSPWAGFAPEAAVALEWGPKADKPAWMVERTRLPAPKRR